MDRNDRRRRYYAPDPAAEREERREERRFRRVGEIRDLIDRAERRARRIYLEEEFQQGAWARIRNLLFEETRNLFDQVGADLPVDVIRNLNGWIQIHDRHGEQYIGEGRYAPVHIVFDHVRETARAIHARLDREQRAPDEVEDFLQGRGVALDEGGGGIGGGGEVWQGERELREERGRMDQGDQVRAAERARFRQEVAARQQREERARALREQQRDAEDARAEDNEYDNLSSYAARPKDLRKATEERQLAIQKLQEVSDARKRFNERMKNNFEADTDEDEDNALAESEDGKSSFFWGESDNEEAESEEDGVVESKGGEVREDIDEDSDDDAPLADVLPVSALMNSEKKKRGKRGREEEKGSSSTPAPVSRSPKKRRRRRKEGDDDEESKS